MEKHVKGCGTTGGASAPQPFKELGPEGITVNAVAPGPTDTRMVSALSREWAPEATPLGRLGRPADIADVVAFLVSDDAHWITGQIIHANGGIV